MPTLHVLQGPDKGRVYQTPDEPAIIGRSSDQIHLSDHGASRRHAEIFSRAGHWVLVDLKSSNGTYVNGRRVVAPTVLQHGDQIKIGSTLMVFSGPELVGGPVPLQVIHDIVELDMAQYQLGASILSSVDASAESVILQAPETADAVTAWNVLYKIAETVGTTASVEVFLERVADILFEFLLVDQLVMFSVNADTDELEPQAVRARQRDRGRRPTITTSQSVVNHVRQHREGVLCANAMTDERFSGDANEDSIHRLGLRSIICVPIIAHEHLHGAIYLDCSMTSHTYSQEQLRLAVAIGRLTGLAIENVRLTESRVRNERLAAAGEAVAYLSHYIRNILQGMQGGAEVIELGFRKDNMDTSRSGWNLVRRNLDRILNLAMNMLTFSKERQPKIAHVQLNKILGEVLSLAQSRADEKNVMLLADTQDLPSVPVDPDGLHQVIHNIVLNAIEAVSPETGRVNLSTEYDPIHGAVVVVISDNGPGIAPDDVATIFDPFHSSKGQGGTGLGLAAAKKIMDEMKGSIEVDGRPGTGAMFRIIVPTDRVRLADAPEAQSASASR